MAATRPDLAPVIGQAVRLADYYTRFEPDPLPVSGLILLALQTEITLDRNTAGEWQFWRHKKAPRDATLGRLLGQLLAFATARQK